MDMPEAWTVCGCPASWFAPRQGVADVDPGRVEGSSPVVEDAASAPAQLLEDYRKADSARRRKSAEAAGLACVVDGLAGRGWSWCDGDARVDVVEDAAWDAVMCETRDAICLEAVVRVLAETAAWHHLALEVRLVVSHV